MRRSKSNLLLMAIALMTVFSCTKNDNDPTPNSNVNLTAKTDGMAFESGGLFVAAALSTEKTGFYVFVIEAFDYDNVNTGKGRAISISLSGYNFDNLQAGAEFTDYDITTGEGATGTYLNSQSFDESTGGTSLGEDGSAYVKITAIDKAGQKISGEFAFDVYDDETGDHYKITGGRFTDLNYTVED